MVVAAAMILTVMEDWRAIFPQEAVLVYLRFFSKTFWVLDLGWLLRASFGKQAVSVTGMSSGYAHGSDAINH